MSPFTDAESFEFHPFQQTDGGIQLQDPNLQRKLNTDLSGPAAVVLCPQCLLDDIPKYQSGPLPPVRLKSEPRFPPIRSHRFHYPGPRPLLATRAALEPLQKRPHLPLKFDELPFPCNQKHQNHSKWRTFIIVRQPELCTCCHSGTDWHWAFFFASWRSIV